MQKRKRFCIFMQSSCFTLFNITSVNILTITSRFAHFTYTFQS